MRRFPGLRSLLALAAVVWSITAAGAAPATRPGAATRPAADPPAAGRAAAPAAGRVRVVDPANFRASQRAMREQQRQSIMKLRDGGILRFDELVRFTVVDGRLRSELVANFPIDAAPAQRIRIEGSDAVWLVTAFNNAQQRYHSLVRYEFDAPDDQIWMISYSFQANTGITTLLAQGGAESGIARLYFSQRPGSVSLNVSAWENGRMRNVLVTSAADLFKLRGDHPDAVRRFLLPVLRKLTLEPILRPGAVDVYRVFTQLPEDPAATAAVLGLLPELSAQSPEAREQATRRLMELGPAGAVAAMRLDPELLLPEQASRLQELIAAHSRMIMEDPTAALRDHNFLVDCLEDEDQRVRAAAKQALEKLLGREVGFDVDAPAAKREAAADQLRLELGGEAD